MISLRLASRMELERKPKKSESETLKIVVLLR